MEEARDLYGLIGDQVMLYMIGLDSELGTVKRFADCALNNSETLAIAKLHNRFEELSRSQSLSERGVLNLVHKACNWIEDYRLIQKNIFDETRLLAGHQLHEAPKVEDPLLDKLYRKLELNFSLLILDMDVKSEYRHSFMLGDSVSQLPSKELREDSALNSLFKNKVDNLLGITLKNGTKIGIDGNRFEEVLVRQSFQNCCSRGSLTFSLVADEIKQLLDQLRELSSFKETSVSYFVGLKGAKLKNDLKGKQYTLRNIQRGLTAHINKDFRADLVAEIKVSEQRIDKQTIHGSIHSIGQAFDSAKQFRLAIALTKPSFSGPRITYIQPGFGLSSHGYTAFGFTPFQAFDICENDQEIVQEFFDMLTPSRIGKIKFALDRLSSAIFDRWDMADSILDGLIVWDCLFGSQGSSSFKICACISRYLEKEDLVECNYLYGASRLEFFDALKKIYINRNDLVHEGRLKKNITNEERLVLRKEILVVAVSCLRKLLKDDHLLAKLPIERAKYLITN